MPPRWIVEPADQSAILGHQVVITCQADGFPQPSVVWKQAIGEQTGEYRELSFASSGGSSSSSSASMSNGPSLQTFSNGTLSIQNVTRHNQGDYLCQANNGIGAGLSKLIRLTVHVGPQVLLRNKQVSVRRGETINLHCEADGDKPLTVTWRAKGQRIDSTYDVRYQINTNPLNKGISSELTISQTTLSDRGEYSCIAANAFGTDHSTVHLQVQEPPSFPRNLHVTQLKADSVHLMWTPGDQDSSAFQPVTNYIVQYKEAEDTWRNNNHKKVVAGDKTDAFIDSLKPATNYHFRIYAENHLGTSAASDILNVIMGKPPDLIHYCTPLPVTTALFVARAHPLLYPTVYLSICLCSSSSADTNGRENTERSTTTSVGGASGATAVAGYVASARAHLLERGAARLHDRTAAHLERGELLDSGGRRL